MKSVVSNNVEGKLNCFSLFYVLGVMMFWLGYAVR